METYTIIGVEKIYYTNGVVRLSGLRLKGVVGDVDVFVDGNFMPDILKELLDEDGYVETGHEKSFLIKNWSGPKSRLGKLYTANLSHIVLLLRPETYRFLSANVSDNRRRRKDTGISEIGFAFGETHQFVPSG